VVSTATSRSPPLPRLVTFPPIYPVVSGGRIIEIGRPPICGSRRHVAGGCRRPIIIFVHAASLRMLLQQSQLVAFSNTRFMMFALYNPSGHLQNTATPFAGIAPNSTASFTINVSLSSALFCGTRKETTAFPLENPPFVFFCSACFSLRFVPASAALPLQTRLSAAIEFSGHMLTSALQHWIFAAWSGMQALHCIDAERVPVMSAKTQPHMRALARWKHLVQLRLFCVSI
jgi:hypothetical protein